MKYLYKYNENIDWDDFDDEIEEWKLVLLNNEKGLTDRVFIVTDSDENEVTFFNNYQYSISYRDFEYRELNDDEYKKFINNELKINVFRAVHGPGFLYFKDLPEYAKNNLIR